MREYIISLQSRLIDSQNEVPELPGNIDLQQHRLAPHPLSSSNPTAVSSASASSALPAALAGATPAGTSGPSHDQSEQVNALDRIAAASLGARSIKHQQPDDLFSSSDSKRPRTDGLDASGLSGDSGAVGL